MCFIVAIMAIIIIIVIIYWVNRRKSNSFSWSKGPVARAGSQRQNVVKQHNNSKLEIIAFCF